MEPVLAALIGGFGQNHHVAKIALCAALLVMIDILFQGLGLFGCFQPFYFLLILAVLLSGKRVYQLVKKVGVILKQVRYGQFGFNHGYFGVNRGNFIR